MIYIVCGFQGESLNTAALRERVLKVNEILVSIGLVQIHTISGYSVDAAGHEFLAQRFGREFDHFVVLDEMALEACRLLRISHGQELGTIERQDIESFTVPLFHLEYYTEV